MRGIGRCRHDEGRTVDRARGTIVALCFSGAAATLAIGWYSAFGWTTSLGPLEIGALLVAVALAEQVAVTIGRRTTYTFSAPLLVLAALLGGPLTGLLAGALTGVGRRPRRLAQAAHLRRPLRDPGLRRRPRRPAAPHDARLQPRS